MLIAVGDSITADDHGPEDDEPGLPYRPWVVWLARSLDLQPDIRAVPGGKAAEVAAALGPLPDAAQLGAIYVGVNDVRDPGWDPAAFRAGLGDIVTALALRCGALLLCTVPLDLGRPRAGAKVHDCNAIIRHAAAGAGAVVCELDDLGGDDLLYPDAVHPRASGQLEIADRAARVLGVPMPSGAVT